jgi:signal transduction histidine kinase
MAGGSGPGGLRFFFKSVSMRIVLGVLVLVLPINAVLLAFSQNDRETVKEDALSAIGHIGQLYMARLENEAARIDAYCLQMMREPAFVNLALGAGNSEYQFSKYSLAKKFSAAVYNSALPTGYFIFARELNDAVVTTSGGQALKEGFRSWLKALGDEGLRGFRQWSAARVAGHDVLLRISTAGGLCYGGFVELGALLDELGASLGYERSGVALRGVAAGADSADGAVYGAVYGAADGADPASRRGEGADGLASVQVYSDRLGLVLEIEADELEIFGNLPLFRRAMLAAALASFVAIPLLYVWLGRILIRPLRRIASALNRMENGDREYRIAKRGCASEFMYINQSFNAMADQISRLEIEGLERELERQKIELRNFQLQVRPHFLLNSFSAIYSLAQTGDFSGIQKTALFLSRYFRSLFAGRGGLQTVEKELALVAEYLDVSKIRYEGSFDVSIDADEDVGRAPVPVLAIHNFVENIIKYAVDVDGRIHIRIAGRAEGGVGIVEISDDGPGIGAAELEAIRAGKPVEKADGLHVGIWTSIYRVRTLCKDGADIIVDSAPGKGTKITVKLPL